MTRYMRLLSTTGTWVTQYHGYMVLSTTGTWYSVPRVHGTQYHGYMVLRTTGTWYSVPRVHGTQYHGYMGLLAKCCMGFLECVKLWLKELGDVRAATAAAAAEGEVAEEADDTPTEPMAPRRSVLEPHRRSGADAVIADAPDDLLSPCDMLPLRWGEGGHPAGVLCPWPLVREPIELEPDWKGDLGSSSRLAES